MSKNDKQKQEQSLNVAALSNEAEPEVKMVESVEKIEGATEVAKEIPVVPPEEVPEVKHVLPEFPIPDSDSLAHPIMDKPANVMHQMVWPGKELKPSHGGIVGEIQAIKLQADKEKNHAFSASLNQLLEKISDASNHINAMSDCHVAHEVIQKLKSLFHG